MEIGVADHDVAVEDAVHILGGGYQRTVDGVQVWRRDDDRPMRALRQALLVLRHDVGVVIRKKG